jgi:hypothetical protein
MSAQHLAQRSYKQQSDSFSSSNETIISGFECRAVAAMQRAQTRPTHQAKRADVKLAGAVCYSQLSLLFTIARGIAV